MANAPVKTFGFQRRRGWYRATVLQYEVYDWSAALSGRPHVIMGMTH